MRRTIRAIYENGVFRPEGAVRLPAGTAVEVLLPDISAATAAPFYTSDELRDRFVEAAASLASTDDEEIARLSDDERERLGAGR